MYNAGTNLSGSCHHIYEGSTYSNRELVALLCVDGLV